MYGCRHDMAASSVPGFVFVLRNHILILFVSPGEKKSGIILF